MLAQSQRPADTTPHFAEIAKIAGEPQVPGLTIVYLTPLGDPRLAPWKNIIVHQTEGPAGSALAMAKRQARNPMVRGVTLWVETDGTVYWATPESAITAARRRRQPQRQQVHRQQADPPPGDPHQFDRRRVRRQLSRRAEARDRAAGRRLAGAGDSSCRSATASRSNASTRTTGSTTRTTAIARAAISRSAPARWPTCRAAAGQKLMLGVKEQVTPAAR